MNKLEIKNYIDVTEEWLNKPKSKKYKVKEQLYFDYNYKRYHVDNKNVILDYNKKELEIAKWLVKTFGGKIYMLPRINKPDSIKTPDYLWNNEYWDLKEIKGNGKHTLDSAIKKERSQANNFIIDISNSPITKDNAIEQLKLVFNAKERIWISKIILKYNNNIIVYKRKKEINHQSQNTDQD